MFLKIITRSDVISQPTLELFFEGDHVELDHLTVCNQDSLNEVSDFLLGLSSFIQRLGIPNQEDWEEIQEESKGIDLAVIKLYQDPKETKEPYCLLVSFSDIYLMNNDGHTVDKYTTEFLQEPGRNLDLLAQLRG